MHEDSTLLMELYRQGSTGSMEDSALLVELYRPVFRTLGRILLWVTRFYKLSLLVHSSESGVRHTRLVYLSSQMGLVAHTQLYLLECLPVHAVT